MIEGQYCELCGGPHVVGKAIPDEPCLDGTDFAHPAWWRGQEQGVNGVLGAINRALSGDKHKGVYGNPTLEETINKIEALVTKHGTP